MKNFIMIVLKNALNAILTNAALMTMMHGTFNKYSKDGLWNMGKAALAVIVAREIVVWGPMVMKWTTTNADPNAATSVPMTKVQQSK